MRRSLPDKCRCGSQQLQALPQSDIRTMPYSGTLSDGYEFNSIRWERKQCSECGQMLVVKTYLP